MTAAFDVPVLELHVTDSNPAAGSIVGASAHRLHVRLFESRSAASVAAADLKVNNLPASSFTILDVDTVKFHYASSPVTSQGLQTMAIAAGAILRQNDNQPLLAFNQSFRYDQVLLACTVPVSRRPPVRRLPCR